MKTEYQYTFTFNGRENGAIGITLKHRVSVMAENVDAAKLALYNTHEHISSIECVHTSDPALLGAKS